METRVEAWAAQGAAASDSVAAAAEGVSTQRLEGDQEKAMEVGVAAGPRSTQEPPQELAKAVEEALASRLGVVMGRLGRVEGQVKQRRGPRPWTLTLDPHPGQGDGSMDHHVDR